VICLFIIYKQIKLNYYFYYSIAPDFFKKLKKLKPQKVLIGNPYE